MGTRALYGYERPDGKIYVQYTQFDNEPNNFGKFFYQTIVDSLTEGHGYFWLKKEMPNKNFFKRINDYLNEIQYRSHHSIANNHVVDEKWWSNPRIDSRWKYLWDFNGNFQFTPVDGKWTCTIPWTFTLNFVKSFGIAPFRYEDEPLGKKPFGKFWNKVTDKANNKEKESPELSLVYGKVLNSDDGENEEYKNYACIELDGKKVYVGRFGKLKPKTPIIDVHKEIVVFTS